MSSRARPLVVTAAVVLLTGCTDSVEGSASPGTGGGSGPADPGSVAGSGPDRELLATVDLTPHVTPGYFPRLIEPDGAGGAFVLLDGDEPFGTELVHLTAGGSGGLTGVRAVPIPRALVISTMDALPDGTVALTGAITGESGFRRAGALFVDPATGMGPGREYVEEVTLSGPPFTAVSPDGTVYYALAPGRHGTSNRLLALDVASGRVVQDVAVGSSENTPVALTITPDGDRLIAASEEYVDDGFRVTVRRFDADLAEEGTTVPVGEVSDAGFGSLGVTEDGTAIITLGRESADVYALPPDSDEAAPVGTVEREGGLLTLDAVVDPGGTWVTLGHDDAAITVDLTSGAPGREVTVCETGLGIDALTLGDDRGSVLLLGTCNSAAAPQTPYVWILGPPT